jgi:hypothetical protein
VEEGNGYVPSSLFLQVCGWTRGWRCCGEIQRREYRMVYFMTE